MYLPEIPNDIRADERVRRRLKAELLHYRMMDPGDPERPDEEDLDEMERAIEELEP